MDIEFVALAEFAVNEGNYIPADNTTHNLVENIGYLLEELHRHITETRDAHQANQAVSELLHALSTGELVDA